MSEYLNQTQEQEFKQIKDWFKKNGTSIMVTLIIILGSYTGWNLWQNYQENQKLAASAEYSQVFTAFVSDPKMNAVVLEKFAKENSNAYSAFASFHLAKFYVEQQDYKKAVTVLERVVDNNVDNELTQIAQLRLAKIYFQVNKFDKALASLDKVQSSGKQQAGIFELKGDIFTAKQDKDKAKEFYRKSLEINDNPIVLLKLNQL